MTLRSSRLWTERIVERGDDAARGFELLGKVADFQCDGALAEPLEAGGDFGRLLAVVR